jgi:transcriptional regulator with XRE-family HTH domain
MNITTELVLGFGRMLRAIRQRDGLTQKQLADGMDVSLAQVKKYEQENLEEIGPNGFSVMTFSKLAGFLDAHPAALFAEMLSHTGLGVGDTKSQEMVELFAGVSSASAEALREAHAQEGEPFGNHAHWCLNMAGGLARLPEAARARIGLEILRELLEAKAATRTEVTRQMQDLFAYTLSAKD